MKTFSRSLCIVVFLITIILFYACKKDKPLDERDDITGNYYGICIFSLWNGSTFNHDTSNIKITLLKAKLDSVIDVISNPTFSDNNISFYFHNNTFDCKEHGGYNYVWLKMSNDSLIYHLQPGLGPAWYDCKVKK